jgi:hypothetical protein
MTEKVEVRQLVNVQKILERGLFRTVLTVPCIYQTDEGVCIETTKLCVQLEAGGPGIEPIECSSREVE